MVKENEELMEEQRRRMEEEQDRLAEREKLKLDSVGGQHLPRWTLMGKMNIDGQESKKMFSEVNLKHKL